ncbi:MULTISPECIES: hypothetical protein [Mycobacteriaceae]|uniref:hypothetical protein n=1 Tax=Mycobacteriaceae TaxID=1762 RepID=UPI000993E6C0|nr:MULTISPECIES: hypothetical protein [Mycobacteriaceae]MDO3058476.1 hypothetical protein [Mycobacteroides abscessus subsp. abscessus]MDO3277988.1 hypothetical protein [Mycobacteroides abscessus subsp. abscessus]
MTKQTTPSNEDKADSAAEAEAKGIETMTLEFGGHGYEIPSTVDGWPIDALEAAEAGLPSALMRSVLGPAQYAAFKARHRTVKDLRDMSDLIAQTSGFTALGN